MRGRGSQAGASLVEVLVSIVICGIGLLGIAGLQSRLQVSQVESYQRAQALLLLADMASRITTNRAGAADYITASALGAGISCPATDGGSTLAEIDAAEWCMALQGAAEVRSGENSGAMIGARGCVQQLPDDDYLVTVVWQGTTALTAPPDEVTCGAGQYDDGTACPDDRCRRAITTVVRVSSLS
jgi:type IV pilus assembly protein PilV